MQLTISTAAAASGSGAYSAQLISPTAGVVLPNINLTGCEMEVWLSLDGGRTFTTCITPILDPQARSFNWTVPNLPTNAAVLDIHFGCEGWYPESYAPQPASTFVIAKS